VALDLSEQPAGCSSHAAAAECVIQRRIHMSIRVAVMVGSLRKDSFNRRLARAVERLAPDELAFEPVDIGGLPLYDQDFDGDYPAPCRQLKQRIEAADAL